MPFGVTTAGFTRKTFTDITSSVFAAVRSAISAVLDLSERSALGNVLTIQADEMSSLWEHAEAAYNAFDVDNADEDRFRALCLLTGVTPGGATKGTVVCQLDLDAGKTFAPGALTVNVAGEPSNLWTNVATVTSVLAGVYDADFIATVAGVVGVAPAGSLTVITTGVGGFNTVTNALDATPGVDIESFEDLRARREASIAVTGSGTLPALKADLSAVAGVISVEVTENTTDFFDTNGLPPHSFTAVVWDGAGLDAVDNNLAQVIYDSKPAGITVTGSSSGDATAADGSLIATPFSRAAQVLVEVAVTITTDRTIDVADVKEAIVASHATATSVDVSYNKMTCSVFDVAGVTDWTVATVNIVGDPVGTIDIPIDISEVGLLDTSRVTVTLA